MEKNHPSRPGFNSDSIASARRHETETAALADPVSPAEAITMPEDPIERTKNLRDALRAGDMEGLKSGTAFWPQPKKPKRHLKIVNAEDK